MSQEVEAGTPAVPAPSRSSIDDIIDLYKRDLDRTLLAEQLKKTVAERARDLEEMVRFLTELRAGVKPGTP